MTRLVDRLAGALDHRLSRRGFLHKTAIAGTAMAVAPKDYLLTPVGAYQAICSCAGQSCGCGTNCCEGYTEFCCTLTGLNRCPPGSILGGWWKVDGSNFCGGGPRYYMDCNAPCGNCGCGASGVCSGSCSGTACGCARGDCNLRRSGCVHFRYGQCNQQIACIGPIQCRVVTCVAPWSIDATCTRTVAVDEYTRNHTAPCLHRPFGDLNWIFPAPNGIRIVGWAVDPDVNSSLTVHAYLNGAFVASLVADQPRPDVAAAYPGAGDRHGFDADIRIPAGQHTLTLYAINAGSGSENPVIATRSVGVGAPFGWLDVAVPAPGGVRVAGWTIDPDAAGHRTEVHAYVDGRFAGAFPADRSRPDLTSAYRGFGPDHGFDFTLAVPDGNRLVEVWAVNAGAGGAPTRIGSKFVQVGGSVIGAFEWALRAPSGIRVTGWALDPDVGGDVEVHVYVDDVYAGQGVASVARPDIAASYPGYGNRLGFDVEVPAASGQRTVRVYGINRGSGAPYTDFGTQTVNVGHRPFGWVDLIHDHRNGVRVVGWCIDPDTTEPVDIHVWADGQFLGVGRANRERPDLLWGYPGYGASHGFDFVLPAPAGQRTVCVYGFNVGPGDINPLLGCRTVTLT